MCRCSSRREQKQEPGSGAVATQESKSRAVRAFVYAQNQSEHSYEPSTFVQDKRLLYDFTSTTIPQPLANHHIDFSAHN